jgi:ribonuclease J
MSKTKQLAALALGGVGHIGTNMMVYECDGQYIVVDAGVSFPDDTTPGVDVIVPDTRFLREHAKQIKGIFITHAHEDHIGGVGYMWDDFAGAPVYASPLAMMVIQGKLQELGIKPASGQLRTITVREQYTAGPFSVEYVPVSHSVPESFALAIRTPHGTVVHTGDYKFDDHAPFGQKTDDARLAEIGREGVLAVFGDSTNILKMTDSGSEKPVLEHLTKLVQQTKGRLFFAAFASHFGRTFAVAKVAAENGRKVCFLGRTINKFISHSKQLGYWPKELNNMVVDAEEAAGLPDGKVFVFASGTQGEGGSSLTRLSQGADVRGLKLKADDTVILSSRMIPGNERAILNVINGLSALNVNVISELTDNDIHVSGHGSRQEIQRMYKLLKPKYVVPVHGEPYHLKPHGEFAKAEGYIPLQMKPGLKLVLGGEGVEKAHHGQHAHAHGFNYVDGLNILEHDPLVLRERRKLGFDGLVTAALAIRSHNKEWLGDLSLSTRGLLDEVLQRDIIVKGIQKTMQTLEKVFPDGIIDDQNRAAETITQALRKHFKLERGKAPVIVVNFVEI